MYSLDSLKEAIDQLFEGGIGEDGCGADDVAELMEGIDYPSLLQAVRHNMKTVFAYSAEDQHSPGYRGADLFGQQAVMIYDTVGQFFSIGTVFSTRNFELWLLEDMQIAIVVHIYVSLNGDEYEADYRESKGIAPKDCGKYLNLEILSDTLDELCVPVYEGKQPFYEL